jgi:hypothetical protein
MCRAAKKGIPKSMISIRIDIGKTISRYQNVISAIQDKDKMLRSCAAGVLPEMKTRIHVKGLDSEEKPIGTYSEGYMKVRTGNFANSKKFTKGKNKGKLKDAGVKTKKRVLTPFGKTGYAFTNIESEGIARPKYNRSNDTKKIYSLTRQMENDFSVQATDKGYGLGFNNPYNAQKAEWVQEQDKKTVYNTTEKERKLAVDIAIGYIQKITGAQ